MNLFKLSWKYLIAQPLSTLLSTVLVALGVSLASILFLLNQQFQDRLYRNIQDVDLVVSAKGSPLQMILSAVYHIDAPTGNIPLKESFVVTKNPYVEKAIPLALGDSYNGFRIVGTDGEYAKHYKAEVAEGRAFEKDLEVTVGARAAKKLGLKLGDTFYGSHGLVQDGGHVHETYAYTVVGIYKPSNLVLDQLILTNVSTVWRMHEDHDHDHGAEGHDHGQAHDNHDHGAEGHNHGQAHDSHDHGAEGHDHGQAHDDHDHGAEGHDHGQAHDDHDHGAEGHDHGQAHDNHDHEAEGHNHGQAHDNHDHGAEGHDHGQAHDDHDHGAEGHDHGHAHDNHDHGHDHQPKKTTELPPISKEGKEVTAYLVQYKKDGNGNTSMRAAVEAAQIIDDNSESLGYAKPAIQLQRLLEMTGVGMDFLRALALIIILISAFSMFISLYNSLKDRRYEMALMRVMGASRGKLFAMIILEGILVAIAGFVLGTLISHIGMEMMAAHLEETYKYTFSGRIFLQEEVYLGMGTLVIGFLAAVIPAIQAYKADISETLTNS